MQKKHTEVKKVSVTKTYCDVCGGGSPNNRQCWGCKKDLCGLCRTFLYLDPFTLESNGDYSPYICHKCDKDLGPFRKRAADINSDYEKGIEQLEREWKERNA